MPTNTVTPLRQPTLVDDLLSEVGHALQVLGGRLPAQRPNPADQLSQADSDQAEAALSDADKRHAAGLMRVNHVGEICAQALYRGQAMFCKNAAVQDVFLEAATEEVDHLVWCHDRLQELSSRASVFNPLWYAGSFTLGLIASRASVAYNLGFMAETERQVEEHLDGHIEDLPAQDARSRAIVAQMRLDEIEHRTTAEDKGSRKLPLPIRLAMRGMSKVMTTTACRL